MEEKEINVSEVNDLGVPPEGSEETKKGLEENKSSDPVKDHESPAVPDASEETIQDPDTILEDLQGAEVETDESEATPVSESELPSEEEIESEIEVLPKLSNERDSQEDQEEEIVDYSTFSKEALVEAIIEKGNSEDIIGAFKHANEMAPFFNGIRAKEKEEALKSFLKEGGEEGAFEINHDDLTDRFEANFRLIRDKRNKYIKEREQSKEANYQNKLEVLEKLREFVEGDETNISFNAFKEIQEEWRAIGPVPHTQNRTLWANYHALIDRFYDNRSIYFELKELDRRKNLEQKQELCGKAEKLAEVEILKDAIRDLNDLHEEFKHIGPVPKDDQENLWERFKTASDAVYARRKAYVADLKKSLDENLVKKQDLVTKAESHLEFKSDRIKEWNKKTNEILALQKEWEAIGGVPRSDAKEINKKFWGAFKAFFNHKNQFFKQLDSEREGNLKKKQELVNKANELKESQEWDKTAEAFKNLQKEWRKIGPVPQKMREKIFQEFKSAADHFFNEKRANLGSVEAEYQENLKKKEEIVKTILKGTGKKDSSREYLAELEANFNKIGFVPRKSVKSIREKFKEAVENYISKLPGLSDREKEQILLHDEINQIAQGPNSDQKLVRREQGLRREIGQLENDIALWTNNLEFFAASKTADALREEFEAKISKATEDLNYKKKQLRLLRKSH